MKTNIRQSYAAVFETEQPPPMISASSVHMKMRLFASDRPFSCPAETSISLTTVSVRLVQFPGPSHLSIEHLCNRHVSFCPARVAVFHGIQSNNTVTVELLGINGPIHHLVDVLRCNRNGATFRVVHGYPTSLTWYSASSSISHSSVSSTFMKPQRISFSLGMVESMRGICSLLTFFAMSRRDPRSFTQFHWQLRLRSQFCSGSNSSPRLSEAARLSLFIWNLDMLQRVIQAEQVRYAVAFQSFSKDRSSFHQVLTVGFRRTHRCWRTLQFLTDDVRRTKLCDVMFAFSRAHQQNVTVFTHLSAICTCNNAKTKFRPQHRST